MRPWSENYILAHYTYLRDGRFVGCVDKHRRIIVDIRHSDDYWNVALATRRPHHAGYLDLEREQERERVRKRKRKGRFSGTVFCCWH